MSVRIVVFGALGVLGVLASVPASAQDKVEVCHNGHTIEIGAAAEAAHLSHGDTQGPCGAETGSCLCNESTYWQLINGSLYCTSTAVTDGRLEVCENGTQVCQSLTVSGEVFEASQCGGCLPATVSGTTYSTCGETAP